MLAIDFFRIDHTVMLRGPCVLFVLEVADRPLHIRSVTAHPDRHWTSRQGSNLMMDPAKGVARARFWYAIGPNSSPPRSMQ